MIPDTTWHAAAVLVLALAGLGCSSAHDPIDGSVTDGGIADGSVADGSMLSECAAFTAGAGAPCSFEGTCVVPRGSGEEIRECCSNIRACEDGLATVTERCASTPPVTEPWTACWDYLDARGFCSLGGQPGDPCDVTTFGECETGERRGRTRCAVTATCVDGVALEECTACVDEVAAQMDVEVCRSDDDCAASGESCFRDDDELCGPCMTPTRECESDAECATGTHCEVSRPDCSCGGLASTCEPDCSTLSDCGGNAMCLEDGRCDPISCDEGFDCPPNTRCLLDGSGDAHDCARLTCTADSECDCGFCVRGACVSSIGTCMVPPS